MFKEPLNRLARTVAALLFFACGPVCATGLLKDIAPGGAASYDDLVGFWLPFDGDVVFWGKGSLGIWRTDGTTAGTVMIQPYVGTLSGVNVFTSYGIAADKAIFFYADDTFYGSELWRTDGTNGGALRLTDIGPGSQPANISYWITSSGVFYFQINTTLYKTDGTTPVAPVFGGGTDEGSATVVNLRDNLIFSCGINFVRGPCVRNAAGTVTLLKQLSVTSDYVPVNEKVFFTATTTAEGEELWVTDGTVGGTHIVADLVLGTPDSSPAYLTRMDDKVYFIARDATHGRELWTSDGTTTTMIVDLNEGSGDGAYAIFAAIDSTLYFRGYDAAAGYELFRTGGTNITTTLVKDTKPGTAWPAGGYASAFNGQLFMGIPTGGSFSTTLWVSDGTNLGTRPLDANAGLTYGNHLAAANGKLIFPGLQTNSTAGLEPLEINLERVTGHKWCSRPEKIIPDYVDPTPGSVSDAVKIPEWGGIESMTVSIDIGHTYVNDLVVTLLAPDHSSAVLLSHPLTAAAGSCTGDLISILLDDDAASAAQTSCINTRFAYPLHGTFHPLAPLSGFTGKSTKGKWTLRVTDAVSGDIGTFHEWCMDFQTDRLFDYGFDD